MKLKDIEIGEVYAIREYNRSRPRVVLAVGKFNAIEPYRYPRVCAMAEEAGQPKPDRICKHESNTRAVVVDWTDEDKAVTGKPDADRRQVVRAQDVQKLWSEHKAEEDEQDLRRARAAAKREKRKRELEAVFAAAIEPAKKLGLPALEAVYRNRSENVGERWHSPDATGRVDLEKLSVELQALVERLQGSREALAALEHEQWAHWTRYMLETLDPLFRAAGRLPPHLCEDDREAVGAIRRWRKQIETDYTDLSEREKASDREWADRALEILHGKGAPS